MVITFESMGMFIGYIYITSLGIYIKMVRLYVYSTQNIDNYFTFMLDYLPNTQKSKPIHRLATENNQT